MITSGRSFQTMWSWELSFLLIFAREREKEEKEGEREGTGRRGEGEGEKARREKVGCRLRGMRKIRENGKQVASRWRQSSRTRVRGPLRSQEKGKETRLLHHLSLSTGAEAAARLEPGGNLKTFNQTPLFYRSGCCAQRGSQMCTRSHSQPTGPLTRSQGLGSSCYSSWQTLVLGTVRKGNREET